MRLPRLLVLVLVFETPTSVVADDWIGLDEPWPVLLGIDFGEDEDGDENRALMIDLPLSERAGVYGYYGETELDDFDKEFESLTLATTLWLQLSTLVQIELQHFFEGNDDELEQETLGLALGLSQGEWNFSIQLESGEALFFTRDDLDGRFDGDIPDRLESDLTVIGLSIGSNPGSWYWQAGYRRYDYDEDLSVFARSRFAQLIVKSSTLAQSSLLISQSATLLLGVGDFSRDFSLLLIQERSAIDESVDDAMVLAWQHWISAGFGYQVATSMQLPSEDGFGLTLGLRWAL